ncbi:MAG: gamma carbonic anhydrase family protein [Firmicutes bacterium]|nr:gamma carbonic anhydrase family protein [Bacillota bacterium]
MGDITLGKKVSIWPLAVLRADMAAMTIGDQTNIQDGVVLHVDSNHPLEVGNRVTIGHKAVLHGCTIADNCLIGIGSIVLDGAEIGENCLIAAGSLISPGKKIPANSLVMGKPARIIRSLTPEEIEAVGKSAENYWQMAQKQLVHDNEFVPEKREQI